MYCKNCGQEIDDNAVICTHCGCATNDNLVYAIKDNAHKENGVGQVAKVFMILTCIFQGFLLIPLCWLIPMTVSLSRRLKNNEPISISFKICTFLFCNTIAGILLMCSKN